jgi:hypothetical protein
MFAEDLTAFFNADELADNATLAGVAVVGNFDEASEVVEGDAVTVAPTFVLPTSSAGAAAGSSFIRDGVTYTVRNKMRERPDGKLTRLVLTRA